MVYWKPCEDGLPLSRVMTSHSSSLFDFLSSTAFSLYENPVWTWCNPRMQVFHNFRNLCAVILHILLWLNPILTITIPIASTDSSRISTFQEVIWAKKMEIYLPRIWAQGKQRVSLVNWAGFEQEYERLIWWPVTCFIWNESKSSICVIFIFWRYGAWNEKWNLSWKIS